MWSLLILVLGILASTVVADVNQGWLPYPGSGTIVQISTMDVINWNNVENVNPPLDSTTYYANINSLGPLGPIGCYGPLGMLGPVSLIEYCL